MKARDVTVMANPSKLITDPDEMRRHELSAFLRSRRERLTPRQAGLQIGRAHV